MDRKNRIKKEIILTEKSAENFVKRANESVKKRHTQDISEQMKITKAIIKKSKLKLNQNDKKLY